MKHIFITYGDAGFEKTKRRVMREAESIGVFDEVIAYGPENLSEKVLWSSSILFEGKPYVPLAFVQEMKRLPE